MITFKIDVIKNKREKSDLDKEIERRKTKKQSPTRGASIFGGGLDELAILPHLIPSLLVSFVFLSFWRKGTIYIIYDKCQTMTNLGTTTTMMNQNTAVLITCCCMSSCSCIFIHIIGHPPIHFHNTFNTMISTSPHRCIHSSIQLFHKTFS